MSNGDTVSFVYDWKTTTKRYNPQWKTHLVRWKMGRTEVIPIPTCQECNHGTNLHLFDPDNPDFGLCMSYEPENCNCTCRWFHEQIQEN